MALYPSQEAEVQVLPPEERKLVTVQQNTYLPPVSEADFDFPSEEEIKVSLNELQDSSPESEIVVDEQEEEDPLTTPQKSSTLSPQRRKLAVTLPTVSSEDPLPLNVISPTRQAKALGWTLQETKLANRLTGVFSQLPMVCKGTDGCIYGAICPVSNRDDFIGSACPLELMEIFKHFVSYTRELQITVDDHTDLMTVADLCRLQSQMWRTDMSMKLETEIVEETVGVAPGKSSMILKKKAINMNRAAQTQIRNDIAKLYKSLLSTREDKLRKKAAAADNLDSLSVMLSEITNFTNKKE